VGKGVDEMWGGPASQNQGPAYNAASLNEGMVKQTLTPTVAPAALRDEEALAELERLVAAMESGQLPLDDLMQNYHLGAELLQLCRSKLQAVEQQVKVLESGQLKPWLG
jgi:exodeoxyribonuclease VII small subunit